MPELIYFSRLSSATNLVAIKEVGFFKDYKRSFEVKKTRLLTFPQFDQIFLLDSSMVLPDKDNVVVVVLSSSYPNIFIKSVLVVEWD